MIDGASVVIDVGKTHAKAQLRDPARGLSENRSRANAVCEAGRTGHFWRTLDLDGIDAWLLDTLAEFAAMARIRRIVPVAHGAAAALVRGHALFELPVDYESAVPEALRLAYERERDPFSATGSPFLPCALNLGLQLFCLEDAHGPLPGDVSILPWPQLWAWRLSGRMASEVSSLGCHTDLWQPAVGGFSALARRRGWAERFAPLRHAGHVLGPVTHEIARRTGLPRDCAVLCGLHDSNAALHAVRAHRQLADREATVLSTGTWFVAMRSIPEDAKFDPGALSEERDCLVNVDVNGRPVPSARFMGGREAQLIAGEHPAERLVSAGERLDRVGAVLSAGTRIFPSFVADVGPFPQSTGRAEKLPQDAVDRDVAISIYLALMSDTMLDLVGSAGRLVVEGRFADDVVFVRALAALRREQTVYTCDGYDDLALGALRLVDPTMAAPVRLNRVEPLAQDLGAWVHDWNENAAGARVA